MTALVLTLVGAVLIGVSLGLLGGGGSILAVPLLVYVADLPTREAIATSLLVVGATSAVGGRAHARPHRVRWRTGLVFGLAGMTGAYAGGRLAAYVPTAVLLTGFAVMMLATAFAMLRGQRDATADGKVPSRELPVRRVVLDGALVGLVTGLVGAGGGFLVVPALVLLGGLPMPVAIGTSLVVIAMKSVAGLAGYLATVSLDWGLAAAVTAAAVAGSLLGGRLVGRIPAALLRRAFGWFVVAMGVFVLGQQVPRQWWTAPLFWAVSGGLAAALAATVLIRATAERRPSVDSSEWDARYASAPDLVWTAEPNRFVVKETGGLTPGRALDLGAGEGRNAVWLAEQGWRVTAVDFSAVAVERGRKLARERGVEVDWQVADVTSYQPEVGGFDLVLLAYLHLPAPQRSTVLHRAGAAVCPGGSLVLVGHDLANLTNGIGGPQDPTVLQTPDMVVAELSGLHVSRAETAPRPVHTPTGTVNALDTVIVATRP